MAQATDAEPSEDDKSPSSAIFSLAEWVRAQDAGVVSPKVSIPGTPGEVSPGSNGRTLFLRERVEPGDVLIQLPLSALITAAVAEQDDLIGGAFTALRLEDGASELCILVLYLLCLQRLPEMEGASHAAYVRALPSGAPSPLAWPEQTLDVLRASPLAAALKKQADVLEELHRLWLPKLLARLHPPLTRHAGDSRLGKAEVLHAFSMVASRAFSISFPDGAEVLSLIPLVDMLDHSFHVKTKHTTKRMAGEEPFHEGGESNGRNLDVFQLIADTSQEAGEPLWINYGSDKGNCDLLVHHGFCIPDNPADRFTSNLRMGGEVLPLDLQTVTSSAGLSMEQHLTRRDPLPLGLLQAIAALHLPPQCVYYLSSRLVLGCDGSPLDHTPASPLFSGAFLTATNPMEAVPPPLVSDVAATVRRLLQHELGRCTMAVKRLADDMCLTDSRPTGSGDPHEAAAMYLKGQAEILEAAGREAATLEGLPVSEEKPGQTFEPGRWHRLELEVPEERRRLLQLSGLGGYEHWLPELPEAGEAGMEAAAIADVCWRRVMAAAAVCSCGLAELEQLGARRLLEAEAVGQEGPHLSRPTGASQGGRALKDEAAAFRCRVVEKFGSTNSTAAQMLCAVLEDEARQVNVWRKELEEAQEQLKAASALEEELEENISSLEEIMDSAVTLDTWIIRLTRMSVFRRPSSEHDEKRRKTFS